MLCLCREKLHHVFSPAAYSYLCIQLQECFNLQSVNVTLLRAFPAPQKPPILFSRCSLRTHPMWSRQMQWPLLLTQTIPLPSLHNTAVQDPALLHTASSTTHYMTTSSGAQLIHHHTRPRSNEEHWGDSRVLLPQTLLSCIDPTEQQSTAAPPGSASQGWAASWGELWELGIFPVLTSGEMGTWPKHHPCSGKNACFTSFFDSPQLLSRKAPFEPFCLTSPFCRTELQVFLRERQTLSLLNQRTKMKSDSKAHLWCLCLSFTKKSLPCVCFAFKQSKCKKEYSAFTTFCQQLMHSLRPASVYPGNHPMQHPPISSILTKGKIQLQIKSQWLPGPAQLWCSPPCPLLLLVEPRLQVQPAAVTLRHRF